MQQKVELNMSNAVKPAPATLGAVVSDAIVRQCLSLYKPDHICLHNANYAEGTLSAEFRQFHLDFHRRPLQHLSRVQIVHYIGQAGFVLAGCLAAEHRLSPLTQKDYFQEVESEGCTFRRLHLEFRRYLPNSDGTTIVISCDRIRRGARAILLDMRYQLNDNACFGQALGMIPLSASRNS
jgi:hypothetical protein